MPSRDEPHLEKPAGSRIWRTYVYVPHPETGARRRKYISTGCRSRKAARQRSLEIEREAQDPHLARARRTTLKEALGLWLEQVESQVKAGDNAQATHDFYLAKIKALLAVFGDSFRLVQFDSSSAADAYVARRREGTKERKGVGKHTVRKELDVLRWTLELARRRKLWSGIVDDVLPLNYSADYKPRERVVPPAELQQLLPRLARDNAARSAWMVATSGEWGASTRALRPDVAGGVARVRGTKTDYRERVVPLATAWQRSLAQYALDNGEGKGKALFLPVTKNALYQDLKRACAAVGLPQVTANDLRRTCATWLLADGASWDDVAKVMGHVDTRMLHKVYGRISASELRARLQQQLGLGSTAVADGAGKAGKDGIGGTDGAENRWNQEKLGWLTGLEPATPGVTVQAWLWPKGRESHRIGTRRKSKSSKSVAVLLAVFLAAALAACGGRPNTGCRPDGYWHVTDTRTSVVNGGECATEIGANVVETVQVSTNDDLTNLIWSQGFTGGYGSFDAATCTATISQPITQVHAGDNAVRTVSIARSITFAGDELEGGTSVGITYANTSAFAPCWEAYSTRGTRTAPP